MRLPYFSIHTFDLVVNALELLDDPLLPLQIHA